MNRLTKRINGYAHAAEGRSMDSLTGNYCRGEFEATACVERLAEYEDFGLEPSEIKPYIELAEKMNVCDLVRENGRLSHKIRFLEAQLKG